MRLLLKIQYYSFLFGEGANISEIISAFDKVQVVNSDGYGKTERYTVVEDAYPELTLIPNDSVSLPENKSDLLERYHEVAQERDKFRQEKYELEQKLKKIEESLEGEKEK